MKPILNLTSKETWSIQAISQRAKKEKPPKKEAAA